MTSHLHYSQHFKRKFSRTLPSIKLVGNKTIGLSTCSLNWIPPFITIKSDLFELWLSNKYLPQKLLSSIVKEIVEEFKDSGSNELIVRSSSSEENLMERGQYSSLISEVSVKALKKKIIELWDDNYLRIIKYSYNKFATVIQPFIKSELHGHLSNERRISRNQNSWLLEISNNKSQLIDSIRFESKTSLDIKEGFELSCLNKQEVIKVLKNIAQVSFHSRVHYEWIWDGKRLWIVQRDEEKNDYVGTPPGSDWDFKNYDGIIEDQELKVFNTAQTTKNSWRKIECIRTFKKCGLPVGKVYILENKSVIAKLGNGGNKDSKVTSDLEWILKFPAVIRSDVIQKNNEEDYLLPRTETIFTVDQAYKFLFKNIKNYVQQGLSEDKFCFLIHRFIISKSGALAYSEPGKPIIRIDSTWGIVDGLNYHSHDSYEINIENDDLKKKIRCKSEYLDVNGKGQWYSKKSGSKWDWKESLTRIELRSIAEYTYTISSHLKSNVTVMYFVDINPITGYPKILPWFYSTEKVPKSETKFMEVIFTNKAKTIKSKKDFQQLKKELRDRKFSSKTKIDLSLDPSLLRNRELIEQIGNVAQKNDIPIELKGSVLSHAYYVLVKTGAKVKCVDTFEPKYVKQNFFKLVRDLIPVKIESKGEKVIALKIKSEKLIEFLKLKAIEEAIEFYTEIDHDRMVDELADMLEVIRGACKAFDIGFEELKEIADNKKKSKGGFEEGIFLQETIRSSLLKITKKYSQGVLFPFEEMDITKDRIRDLQDAFSSSIFKKGLIKNNEIIIPLSLNALLNTSGMKIPFHQENIQSIEIEYSDGSLILKFNAEISEIDPSQLKIFNY